LMSQRHVHANDDREVSWPVLGALTVPMFLGCFSVYLFRLSGDGTTIAAGLIFLTSGLLACAALILFTHNEMVQMAASAIALVQSVALFTILLPGSGLIYVDAAILFTASAGVVLLYGRSVEMPSLGRTRLKESSVLVVFLLPVLLALGQALFLGLRFWEYFQIGRPSLILVPLLAMWGYVEEGLFRGIVLRSALPLLGGRGAIVLAAFLNSAFMLFWASLPFALFSFAIGLLMGYLYLRSRSLMYVGTMHALQDTWMVISYLALGIAIA
jgi:membrane protease YdiL (CAAX protease family)